MECMINAYVQAVHLKCLLGAVLVFFSELGIIIMKEKLTNTDF